MIPNIISVEIRPIVWTTLYAVLHHCTWMRFITFCIAKHPSFRFRVHSTRVTSSRIALSVSRHLLEAFDQMAFPPLSLAFPCFSTSLILLKLEHSQLLVVLSQALLLRSDHPCSRGLGAWALIIAAGARERITHHHLSSSPTRLFHRVHHASCSALIIIRQGSVYATKKMRRYYAV